MISRRRARCSTRPAGAPIQVESGGETAGRSQSGLRIRLNLPSSAGGALWGQPLVSHPLGPWAGFAVLCGYAVVLIGLAAWRLRRRDA